MRILYHYPLSPFCRKIRFMLAEKGCLFKLENNFVPKMMEKAPLDQPPLLEDDGNKIFDHSVIAEYIEETYPNEPHLLDGSPLNRAEIRRISRWFDEKFYLEVSSHILNEKIRNRLSGISPNSENLAFANKNLSYHMVHISNLLKDNGELYLVSKCITLADITAAAHLSVLDYFGEINWDEYKMVKEWYAKIKSRQSFRPILADRIQGIMPVPYYANPDF